MHKDDSMKSLIAKTVVINVVANAAAVVGLGLGIMAINKYTERKNAPSPKQ